MRHGTTAAREEIEHARNKLLRCYGGQEQALPLGHGESVLDTEGLSLSQLVAEPRNGSGLDGVSDLHQHDTSDFNYVEEPSQQRAQEADRDDLMA